MSLRTLPAVVLVLSLSLPLHAQDSTLAPGTRVRVLSACDTTAAHRGCDVVKGRLLSRTGNELLIQDTEGGEHRVNLSAGARVEQSAGYRHHTLRGMGIGALAGLATGAILVADCTRGGRGEDNGLCAVRLVAAVPIGAGVGALIGALTRTERWEPMPQGRASLDVDGTRVVTWAFHFPEAPGEGLAEEQAIIDSVEFEAAN